MSVSGKFLKVTYGGTPTVWTGMVDWEVSEGGDNLDATTGNNGGVVVTDTGCDEFRITVSWLIDTTTGKFVPFQRGVVFATLKLFRKQDDTTAAYSFATAVVTEARQSARTRGRVEGNATIMGNAVPTRAEPGA